MSLDHEKETIRGKYHLAVFPIRIVDNIVHQFQQKLIDKPREYELIIPDFLLADSKKLILVEILFCISNAFYKKPFKQIAIFYLPHI